MGFKRDTIRVKAFSLLVVPLLSLTAIWAYTAISSIGEAATLRGISERYSSYLGPVEDLNDSLRTERRLSVVTLHYDLKGKNNEDAHAKLTAQRTTTDQALDAFRRATAQQDQASLPPQTTELVTRLDSLPAVRRSIDTGTSSELTALRVYSDLVDEIYSFLAGLARNDGMSLEQYSRIRSLGSLELAVDLLAREQSLIRDAVAKKDLSPATHALFSELATSRKFLLSNAHSDLSPQLRTALDGILTLPVYSAVVAGEDRIVAFVPTPGELPYELEQWLKDGDAVSAAAGRVIDAEMAGALADADERITAVIARTALITSLGLVAVVVSILISIRFGRRLVHELNDLQESAVGIAKVRLPDLVRRLRGGEVVDPAEETPKLTQGRTSEVRQVSEAFDSVLTEAVRASVGQAELRRSVGQVFLNLARRSQSLLHRQLSLLEVMEHRAEDPETLEDLFRLDHLSTRMRRHAENLIILSGAAPSRRWREPVPVFDLVRGAVTEVEDYTRVTVHEMRNAPTVSGAAVTDLMHLVAELIENATVFSPPGTRVFVRGDIAANGYALEIEDRGLGLDAAKLETLNRRLVEPPEFDLADSERLGLFVVARLAARHGVKVVLRPSPYDGVTAIVMIPPTLLHTPEEHPLPRPQPRHSVAPPVTPPVRPLPAPPVAEPTEDDDIDDMEGLPLRVPQTHLAAPLRATGTRGQLAQATQTAEEPINQDIDVRAAERRAGLMTAMQRGWERGRRETGQADLFGGRKDRTDG
ncbi:sensor histidine kinase [Acrocarpospora catenulata]|uniref:sensor histidine kinase n=1 Tax=Acrocarpospora catenulata TaxID=2836182 RepID=UPI001BDAEC67|nr:nitrate- and nitrite sensing domain-containing protein [Acrocarpospora catenulata]